MESQNECLEEIAALFVQGGEVRADGGELLGAAVGSEAAGDLLLELGVAESAAFLPPHESACPTASESLRLRLISGSYVVEVSACATLCGSSARRRWCGLMPTSRREVASGFPERSLEDDCPRNRTTLSLAWSVRSLSGRGVSTAFGQEARSRRRVLAVNRLSGGYATGVHWLSTRRRGADRIVFCYAQ